MQKKLLLFLVFHLLISCFNNKIEEIKDFNFNNLKTIQSSQVNSKYIEGINSKDLESYLLKNNFQIEPVPESSSDILSKKFYFSESEASYGILITGDPRIEKIEFFSKSKKNSLQKAKIFFKNVSKIPIPQVDTSRTRKWTENNMNSINTDLSKATILSNVYYKIEQTNSEEFKLTIKKY